MDLGLRDRVAIVTGGSKGLGQAEAEALAAEGAAIVVATAKSVTEAERVVEDCSTRASCHLYPGGRQSGRGCPTLGANHREDLRAPRHPGQQRGHDGPHLNKPLVDLPEGALGLHDGQPSQERLLVHQVRGAHMITQGWGRIINTSSIHGRVGGRPSLATTALPRPGGRLDHDGGAGTRSEGITANVIAPGFIGTETLRGILAPQTLEKLKQQIPLGRIGEPAEVGRVVAFLASEAASYLNGAVLDISGGRLEYFL